MLRRFFQILLTALLSVVFIFAAGPDSGLPRHRDGSLLLQFKDNVTGQRQKAILAAVAAKIKKPLGRKGLMLDVGSGRVAAVRKLLLAYAEVLWAEPDYQIAPLGDIEGPQSPPLDAAGAPAVVKMASGVTAAASSSSTALPNDTSIGSQWAALNTGQTVNGWTGTPGADERAAAAWTAATGTNSVVVAVLDAGVQYSHPDLIANMWNNPGNVGGCPAGTHGYNVLTSTCDPMDDETPYGGHGTHVAGIIGAVANNAMGVAGVDWTTSIMAIKWVDSGDTGFTSDLITALQWVVQAKQAGVNVRVVNDSQTWVGTAFSQALSDEIDTLTANDILFVTAAGNTAQDNDTTPRYPCSYNRPGQLCVAASDPNDNLWTSDASSGSNYGTTTVQLAAPAVNIYSTKRLSNYGFITGTSMAAPQVSGTAALILSKGYMSVSQLRSAILNSVDPVSSLTPYVATGGRLNVCKAVPGCASGSTATPVISTAPVVTGIPQEGTVMGASTGTWSGLPTTYTYQWFRCDSTGGSCLTIPGATSQSYGVLAGADVGSTLRVTVTAKNTSGSASSQSAASGVVASAATPFALNSTITDGQTVSGQLLWEVTPAQAINFAEFFVDGVLQQTVSTSPYEYNQGTTGTFDTTTLTNGTHVLGVMALSNDNRTYGFYGATVTVANGAPPSITTTSLPNGTQNSSYTATLTASGGVTPYTWTVASGTLPTGLSLTQSSGVISGTPSATGTSNFTVQVKDNVGQTATKALSITVTAGSGGGIALVQSNSAQGTTVTSLSVAFSGPNAAGNLIIAFLRMSTATQTVVISDTAGNSYSQAATQVQTTDGHQIYIFYAKNVAAASTNTITASFSGTNNHPWLAAYEFSGLSTASPLDRVASSQGSGATPSCGPTAATSSSSELVFAGLGMPNNTTVTTTAGSGYTLEQQDTGTSRAATELRIVSTTGTQTAAFTLSGSTNYSCALAAFAATGGSNPPTITTTSLPNGTQNTSYSATLAGSGGTTPYTWSISSGTLPAGLTLAASTGTISGTPTATGTSNFTVKLTDSNAQTATQALSITISASNPPTITTTSLPNGTQNTSYSATLAGSGGTTPYTWSISSGTLPTGLTLAASTGTISGTPTATGTSNFTVKLTDSNAQTATQALSITISASNPPTITTTSLPNGTQNTSYSATLAGSGGITPYTWSISSGTVPTGLTLAASTGTISGTPTATGTSNFTVKLTDSNAQTATKALSITISASNPPTITTTSLPNGTQNTSYSATLTGSGGTTPYTWSISSGTLPTGLTLGASTGTISGTPTATGTSNFTVKLTDSNAQTATQALSITISASNPPSITTTSLPNGTQNTSYSATLAGSGGTTPYTWSISSGTLPTGLTLAASTGTISGTPTATGTSSFTVKLADSNAQTATKALSITIAAAGTPPSITTTSLPNGTQNTSYSATLAGSGGTTPYTWSISSGTLPTGLTLATSTGTISGTPTVTGTSNFTVKLTDSNAQTATKALSITIGTATTIGVIQSASVQGSAVSSVAVPFPSANTAGNLIIAFVRMSSSTQTVTLTDTAGNSYTKAVSQVQSSDGHQIYIFYAKNIAASASNTVKATFSAVNNHPWLAIYEYNGLNKTTPLDQTAAAQGAGAGPGCGPTAATTSANELVFAGLGIPNNSTLTLTAGSGYTLGQQDTSTSRAATETKAVSSSGTQTATFALSGATNYSCVLATFKP